MNVFNNVEMGFYSPSLLLSRSVMMPIWLMETDVAQSAQFNQDSSVLKILLLLPAPEWPLSSFLPFNLTLLTIFTLASFSLSFSSLSSSDSNLQLHNPATEASSFLLFLNPQVSASSSEVRPPHLDSVSLAIH